ncbi:hypothetical protein MPLB_660101 [Mesorhizobium sp. ORS 3324]|nr:hypothetical protein MPLB_660101 [Mesorhizobium sp. ORS 3324]
MQERHRGCVQPVLPVTIRGEGPGRGTRGGADIDDLSSANPTEKTAPDSLAIAQRAEKDVARPDGVGRATGRRE